MALDLIKQYLIGIGFNVDSNSAKEAENSIQIAEEKIKKFNDNSKKGFSESGEAMKDLFSFFQSSRTIGKLFPELQKPFAGLIKELISIKKLYSSLTKKDKETEPKEKTKSEGTANLRDNLKESLNCKDSLKNNNLTSILEASLKPFITGINKAKNRLKEFKLGSGDSLKGVKESAEDLNTSGGKALLGFSFKGVTAILAIIGVMAALLKLTKKAISSIDEMAKKDIEYEKLSKQLWTTKENAKDIDSALKALGATMQDLWLSPTLLKQFNQLRKDSQSLRLPPEFQDNIKVIQGLSLEFKRLKQFGSLAMQWIGHYILKYISGPLESFRKKLSGFNNKFIKIIPGIAKVIGSAIGAILRILLLIFRVLEPIFSIVSKIVSFVIGLIDKIPGPLKKILKIIGIIGALILAGPVGAIVLVIGLLDDLFTFLRGGKSIIGSVFGFFKDIGSSAIASVSNKFGELKGKFKEGMATIKDDWDSYWDKAKGTLDKLQDKAKKVWGNIKEWSKGIWDKTKEFFIGSDVKSKVEIYNKDIDGSKSVAPSYTNTSSIAQNETTTNSNNKIDNKNVIHVYGGNDSKATANAIDRKLKGVTTRNLQGVF